MGPSAGEAVVALRTNLPYVVAPGPTSSTWWTSGPTSPTQWHTWGQHNDYFKTNLLEVSMFLHVYIFNF